MTKNIIAGTKDEIYDIIFRGNLEEVKQNKEGILKYLYDTTILSLINNNVPLFKLLLSWSEPKDYKQDNMINIAIKYSSFEILEFLLSKLQKELTQVQFQEYVDDLIINSLQPFTIHTNTHKNIDILVRYGGNINAIKKSPFDNYESILFSAISGLQFDMIEYILAHPKFDLKQYIKIDGGYSLVKSMINADINPGYHLFDKIFSMKELNIKTSPVNKNNLISYGIKSQYPYAMVKKLLEIGVEIGDKNNSRSPLLLMVKCNNMPLKKLIDDHVGYKCTPNLTAAESRLFKAIRENDMTGVLKEINDGTNINVIKDPFKNRVTPLMLGIITGTSPDIIKTLLKAGADPNIKDINGKTPIEMTFMYTKQYPLLDSTYNKSYTHNGIRIKNDDNKKTPEEKTDYVISCFKNIKENIMSLVKSGAKINNSYKLFTDIILTVETIFWDVKKFSNSKELDVISDIIVDTMLFMDKEKIEVNSLLILKQALTNNLTQLAKAILESNPKMDINAKYPTKDIEDSNNDQYKTTIFIDVIRHGIGEEELKTIEFMVKEGFDYCAKDSNGEDPRTHLDKLKCTYHYDLYNEQYKNIINKHIALNRLTENDAKQNVQTEYEYNNL